MVLLLYFFVSLIEGLSKCITKKAYNNIQPIIKVSLTNSEENILIQQYFSQLRITPDELHPEGSIYISAGAAAAKNSIEIYQQFSTNRNIRNRIMKKKAQRRFSKAYVASLKS